MGSFVDPGAAVHQAIHRCQIKRDNMGRTCITHGDILLKTLREGATWEIECVACISRTQGMDGFYYHFRESQGSISDMAFSPPIEGQSGSNEGLSLFCW
jgi:hypothetical protein